MDRIGYMDPRIWSRLPEHILERILSFLPLKTFLNLRPTCKHFNSMLFSPTFISKHSSSSSSPSPFASFILLSHPQLLKTCPLFNSVVNSWCDTSLPFPQKLSPSALLASSNGLFCFSFPGSSCFIVSNLLSRSMRRVMFPLFPFDFEFLTLVSRPNGYKLFMLSMKGSSNSALVYDSKLGSWKRFAAFNPALNENYHQKGVYYKGYLFFTSLDPFQVVCFHMETGQWETSMVGLPGGLSFIRLVSDEEEEQKLYLIGGVGASGISRSIKVWELRDDEHWVEVETMPEMVCRKFLSVCYHNYEHVYCFWHQGLICVCCYTWPEILYYKVSRKTWHWLPKCPSLPDKWSCGFKWFSFKPQIYATA